jgi:DNA-binding transcriptional LysR family regulator
LDIRQLRYLIALARERHFTRAAEACHVTQPTLSGRIKQLEDELGAAIVVRGQRYIGLTPEGERVLRWAKRIVQDVEGMRQDLALNAGELEGRLALSVVPSALPCVATLTGRMRARFARVGFSIRSRSSREILRDLEELTVDAGLTYVDGVDAGVVVPLYSERYRLFVRGDHPLAARAQVEWAEAARHPLCALTPEMQQRRIVDGAFEQTGGAPAYAIESNSVVALTAHVRAGGFAAVLPECYLKVLGAGGPTRAIPLVGPDVENVVGLVAPERDPQPGLISALLECARDFPQPQDWIGESLIGSVDSPIESNDLRAPV